VKEVEENRNGDFVIQSQQMLHLENLESAFLQIVARRVQELPVVAAHSVRSDCGSERRILELRGQLGESPVCGIIHRN
jgi:hypothetical protein